MRIERILHSHEGAKELNLGTCSQLKEKMLHLFASFYQSQSQLQTSSPAGVTVADSVLAS